MTVIGLLRSWETAFTKSFFICSRFLSSEMSRRIAARPTGSPKGVTTATSAACATPPSGNGSSDSPGRAAAKSCRSGT